MPGADPYAATPAQVTATHFYLGCPEPHWLRLTSVPLFVSQRRLARRKSLPRATCRWALDSGGFTELSNFGQWQTTAAAYATAAERYHEEIGSLDGPQRAENTRLAIEYCLAHPTWRLSTQTHKFLGIP